MTGPVDWSKQGGTEQGYGASPSGYGPPAQNAPQAQPQLQNPAQPQAYPQGGSYGPPPIPPTHAGWAVASVILFWPIAFTAFNASSNVVRLWLMGDYAGAQIASDQAKRLGKIAMWIAIGLYGLLIALYVVIFAVILTAGGAAVSSY